MPTPDEHDVRKQSDSEGYEVTDANVFGVGVFLVSLLVLCGVLFVVAFGIGKIINTGIARQDGPLNKWNASLAPASGKLQNMASDDHMEQEELRRMTGSFSTPRLQTDDGDQDIANMHAREDLLLDNYSWIDQKQGKVRIPIFQAMEMIAQRGLPVAPVVQTEPLMTADKTPIVPEPLTDGFARTGFEQQELQTIEQRRERGETEPSNQAALRTGR